MTEKPPPAPDRRIVQITGLLEATCLRCGALIKDTSTMLCDGRERCQSCDSFNYVIPAPAAKIAVVTNVTARELRYAAQMQMQAAAFLAFIGLADPFVPQPILAPPRR